MEENYVRAAAEVQRIEENKIYLEPGNFFSKRFKKNVKKKEPTKNIISTIPVPEVIESLPNTKKITNLNLKSQLKKDVRLTILSAQNIAANKKFSIVEEGYVKRKKKQSNELLQSAHPSDPFDQVQTIKPTQPIEHNKHIKNNEYVEIKGSEDSENVIKNTILFSSKDNPFDESVLTQNYIFNKADVGTQKKVFHLNLRLGPYKCSYSRNGKYLLATGEKGHISLIDVQNYDTLCELEVEETVRCNTVLHNYKLFAVSQKKYMYIYDNTGMEINCIKDILYTYQMQFLPYHFLLASIGEFGELVYQDISLGTVVTRKKTKRGPCHIMKQNKKNAIIYLGHKNGHVSLWTPNIDKPVCDIFCSYTPISAIGVYDNYLITASLDATYKLWDIRNHKYIQSFKAHNIINNIEISDTSVVAFSMNSHFRAYKDFFTSPDLYLKHDTHGNRISSVVFQPFEDICCLGTASSIQTVIVPGAGIANIDGYLNNPYETKKDVRENEVKALLDKLAPDTITFKENQLGILNPYNQDKPQQGANKEFVGNEWGMKKNKKRQKEKVSKEEHEHAVEEEEKSNDKRKKKGKKTKKVKKNTIRSNIPKYLRKSALDRMKEREQQKKDEE